MRVLDRAVAALTAYVGSAAAKNREEGGKQE
jgi:hypothetical protein